MVLVGRRYCTYLSSHESNCKRKRVRECKAGFINANSKFGVNMNNKLSLKQMIYSSLVIASDGDYNILSV